MIIQLNIFVLCIFIHFVNFREIEEICLTKATICAKILHILLEVEAMLSCTVNVNNCVSKDASNSAPSTTCAQNSTVFFMNNIFAGVGITMSAFLFVIMCAIINGIIIHSISIIIYAFIIMMVMLKIKLNIITQNL